MNNVQYNDADFDLFCVAFLFFLLVSSPDFMKFIFDTIVHFIVLIKVLS